MPMSPPSTDPGRPTPPGGWIDVEHAAQRAARRSRLTLRAVLGIAFALVFAGAIFPGAQAGSAPQSAYVVAPWGSDDGPGTADQPYATIEHALQQLDAGDRLIVREGTYRERIDLAADRIESGRADKPITVRAAAGERVVVQGSIVLDRADFWSVHGINVTWAEGNDPDGYLVEFQGGTGFRFTGAEVWGSRGRGAIFVGNGVADFRLDNLYVHHTYETHGANQDHLISVGEDVDGGTIERNVLANSPNGRGVKLGRAGGRAATDVTIRYNTFYENLGPSNVRLSGIVDRTDIHRNLFVGSGRRNSAVTSWKLKGADNTVSENVAWDAKSCLLYTSPSPRD